MHTDVYVPGGRQHPNLYCFITAFHALARQSSMQELLLRVLSNCPARSGCGQGGVPEHLGEAIWMCTLRDTSEAVWRRKAVQRTVQVSLGAGVRVSCGHSPHG